MIPKDFKTPSSIYTKDFDAEQYESSAIPESYRVDIRTTERFSNYLYNLKIFGFDEKLLTVNGWTLNKASFVKHWYENSTPMVYITDPKGVRLSEYRLTTPFSETKRNNGCEMECRLREIFHFFNYIAQFECLDDFRTVHCARLSSIEDVMLYYLNCLKIKDRLPILAQSHIENSIRMRFEEHLKMQDINN